MRPFMPQNKGNLVYLTRCAKNPTYPKIRLVCGVLERVEAPHKPIERLSMLGHWRPVRTETSQ